MKDEVVGSLVFANCVIVLSDILRVFSDDIWFLCCPFLNFVVFKYAICLTSCSSICYWYLTCFNIF